MVNSVYNVSAFTCTTNSSSIRKRSLDTNAASINSSFLTNSLTSQSIYVYIDDPSYSSFINKIDYKIPDFIFDPNYAYDIILYKTVNERLGQPYDQCYKNVFTDYLLNKTIINYFQSNNATYKQTYCYQLCGELNYINTNPCNCTNTSLGSVTRDCEYDLSFQKVGCTYNYLNNFIKRRMADCKQYCPLECDSIDYTFESSNKSANSTQLFIYFEQLNYVHNFELPKSQPYNLVSNVGGILSLFMGLSFISVFETGQLIFEIMNILCRKKKIRMKT